MEEIVQNMDNDAAIEEAIRHVDHNMTILDGIYRKSGAAGRSGADGSAVAAFALTADVKNVIDARLAKIGGLIARAKKYEDLMEKLSRFISKPPAFLWLLADSAAIEARREPLADNTWIKIHSNQSAYFTSEGTWEPRNDMPAPGKPPVWREFQRRNARDDDSRRFHSRQRDKLRVDFQVACGEYNKACRSYPGPADSTGLHPSKQRIQFSELVSIAKAFEGVFA